MTDMKLRFDVNQAECFRAGINHTASTAVVDIDPAKLAVRERNLIADRLHGIDVCQLWNSGMGTEKMLTEDNKPVRVEAKAPTFGALMTAIMEDESTVNERKQRHRNIALQIASSGIDLDAKIEEFQNTPEAIAVSIETERRKIQAAEAELKKLEEKQKVKSPTESGATFRLHDTERENARVDTRSAKPTAVNLRGGTK